MSDVKPCITCPYRRELTQRLADLNRKRRRLGVTKRDAHVAMIEESLDNTPEGKRILSAIDDLKEQVRARLVEKTEAQK